MIFEIILVSFIYSAQAWEPCNNLGEIKPDTEYCDVYHVCTECGWSSMQCPDDKLFNAEKFICDNAELVKCAGQENLEPCDEIGVLKEHPLHCDLYYECSACGWALADCEDGLYFNPETSTCDKPDNVKCASDDPKLEPCDNIGQLKPDDEHCDHYFKCTKKGWGSLPCEEGLLFNRKSLKCEPASQVKCGGSNNDPTPNGPCDNVDELTPNPHDCHSFYQCAPYGWQVMPCAGNLVFNPNINVCDYAQNYKCTVSA